MGRSFKHKRYDKFEKNEKGEKSERYELRKALKTYERISQDPKRIQTRSTNQ